MKHLIFIITILSFAASCNSDDNSSGLRIEELHEIESEKELNIEQFGPDGEGMFVNVCDGDFTVFKYSLKSSQDGYEDSFNNQCVYFQINNQLESFEHTGEELMEIKAIYQLSCFCDISVTNPVFIENGTISGMKKDDNSWGISINIKVDEEEIIVSNNFSSSEEGFSFCEDVEMVNDIE